MRSDSYRADVGPPDLFDVIGALQFNVLTSNGLREHHKLLDIGCGCLRGGKLFIMYLKKHNYFGVEPNVALLNAGINEELSMGMGTFKEPSFNHSGNFDFDVFGTKFDFILAQSILSHTDKQQLKTCLRNVAKVLSGKFIFTYFKGTKDYNGSGWTRVPSATYTETFIHNQLSSVGLTYKQLNEKHPAGQIWVIATRS